MSAYVHARALACAQVAADAIDEAIDELDVLCIVEYLASMPLLLQSW